MTSLGTEVSGTSLLVLLLLALLIYERRVFSDSGLEHNSLDIGDKPPTERTAEPSTLRKVLPGEMLAEAEEVFDKHHLPIQCRLQDLVGEIYLDIETLRLSNEVPGGWRSVEKFGVAVAITFDIDNRFRAWFENDVPKLIEELKKFERIVTYNGDRFDLVVLSGYGEIRGLPARSFDVLASIANVLGHRVKLDKVASETLGLSKDGDGLNAVRRWREGKRDQVVDYCKKDVELLMKIVAHGRTHGHIRLSGRTVAVDWNPQSKALTQRAKRAKAKASSAAV